MANVGQDTLKQCPTCHIQSNNHIKPCNTPFCELRYHAECLQAYAKTSTHCVGCKEPLVSTPGKQLNKTKLCRDYLGSLYQVLLMLTGPFITVSLAMGKSLTHYDSLAAVMTSALPLLLLPWILLYYQCPSPCFCRGAGCYSRCWRIRPLDELICLNCCVCYDKETPPPEFSVLLKEGYGGMTFLFFLSHSMIALSHCVGHLIMLYVFHIDAFFTVKTSISGLILYYILFVCFVLCVLMVKLFGYLQKAYSDAFEEPVQVYGTLVVRIEG